MTIEKCFNQFFTNLEVRNQEEIIYKIKRIVNILNQEFYGIKHGTDNSYIVGSYGRNSAIHGISDLDSIFVLPDYLYYTYNNYNSNGQSALLQRVKGAIKKTYPRTDIRGDGQVVVIQFATFKVEVCPAFKENDLTFTYPDSNNGGTWKKTNPLVEIEHLSMRNTELNGNLLFLCKAVRAWKNQFGLKIGGLLIDTWCYDFFTTRVNNYSTANFHNLFLDFLGYISTFNSDRKYWYSPGSNQRVYKKSNIKRKLNKSLEIAKESCDTIDFNKKLVLLGSLFGKSFPYRTYILEKAIGFRDTEEFIEDKFPIDIRYRLTIDCEVTQNGFRNGLLRDLRIINNPKSLLFYITSNEVSYPYLVYWKVLNQGQQAIDRNQIRGQIVLDGGQEKKKETGTFNGPHYVECYIIKDDVCVARDRIDVSINIY